MTREKILSAANDLYSRYGIKSVSMDQLAAELRISKKTLYIEFESKDELVSACIEHVFCQIAKFAEKTKYESTCAVEAIVRICLGISTSLSSVCPAFYKDLKRYLEANLILEQHKINLWEKSNELFEKGIEEGDIIKGIDFQFITSILIEQMSQIKTANNSLMIMTILRGICTPQGLNKLNAYDNSTETENTTSNKDKYEKTRY